MKRMSVRTALVAALVLPSGLALGGPPPQRVLEKDPVELVGGREAAGLPEHAIVREGIEYRFAHADNKALFEINPEKYEVADGGACGRMGPLSGLGDARRYAVHAGRIYFFASDGCREGFLKDPAKHIETDDEPPIGTHEQVLAGRATLDKAVAWVGGADRLRGVKSFRAFAERAEKRGEKDWRVTNETVIAFPQRYYQKESWNESWFSTMSSPKGGAMASRSGGTERIADSRTRAFNRSMARWPIVILKAYLDGAPNADCPGFVVLGDGEGKSGEAPVEFVKVWMNGAASRLTVEKATGRPIALAFRGRDGTMRVGDSVRTFTATKTEKGLTLPTAYTVVFEGKDLPQAAARLDGFEVNAEIADELFRLPEWGDKARP